jgi:hypothetical protein
LNNEVSLFSSHHFSHIPQTNSRGGQPETDCLLKREQFAISLRKEKRTKILTSKRSKTQRPLLSSVLIADLNTTFSEFGQLFKLMTQFEDVEH